MYAGLDLYRNPFCSEIQIREGVLHVFFFLGNLHEYPEKWNISKKIFSISRQMFSTAIYNLQDSDYSAIFIQA